MNRLVTSLKRSYSVTMTCNSTVPFPTSPATVHYTSIKGTPITLQVPPTTKTELTNLITPADNSSIWAVGNQVLRSIYPGGSYYSSLNHSTIYGKLLVTINGVDGGNLDLYLSETY